MHNSHRSGFFVETLEKHQVAGLVLSDCAYPAELKTPRHTHQNAFFGFVLRGAYSETYKNRSLIFEPSSLAFHPPGELQHETQFYKTGVHIFRIEIEPVWFERVSRLSASFASPANFRGVEVSRLGFKIYQEFRQMDSVSPFAIEGLMLEILAEVSRHADGYSARKSPTWLLPVREFLHAHFQESLSLTDIAGIVNIHPVYLARAFRRRFHCTIGDYVRKLRIEFACRELVSSNTSLAEIALAAGFCAQSHFNEMFKREIGLTPRQYRNMVNPVKKSLIP